MGKTILNNIESRLQAAKVMPLRDFDLVRVPRRASERIPTCLFGLAVTDDGREQKCIVQDLNENGAGVSMGGIDTLPDEFTLVIDGCEAPTRVRLIWRNNKDAGVEFIKSRTN